MRNLLSGLAGIVCLVLFSFLVAALVVSTTSCNREDSLEPVTAEAISTVNFDVQSTLADYFRTKNDLLMGKANIADLQSFWIDPIKAVILAERIISCRDKLATIDFAYTSYSGDFEVQSAKPAGSDILLTFTEASKQVTNDPDPSDPGKFIITQGVSQYEVLFTLTPGGRWLIKSDTCLDFDPYYVNQQVLDASRDPSINLEEMIIPRYSYNRTAAKNYANQWWGPNNSNYNPAYPSCNCCGGDCTNFVSQCLKAGGWTTNTTWKSGSSCPNTSSAWKYGPSWINYAINSGRVYAACYPDNALLIGDVMQIDWEGNGSLDHTLIVTNRTVVNGVVKIYLSAHNTNQNNRISTYFPGTHYGRAVKLTAS